MQAEDSDQSSDTRALEASESDGSEDGSWETVSEEEATEEPSSVLDILKEEEEGWNVNTSFFDNHNSDSLTDNLEYMLKNFGFALADVGLSDRSCGFDQVLGKVCFSDRVMHY